MPSGAECNGDTCAYKVIVQGNHTDRCDVHNHYYKEGYYAVNEAGRYACQKSPVNEPCYTQRNLTQADIRRLHDDASLLPMESFHGDFPNDIVRLYHFKTKSLADTLWKLRRKEGVNAGALSCVCVCVCVFAFLRHPQP